MDVPKSHGSGHGKHGAGGQSGQTKPITISDDSCSGVDPVCDSSSKFRTITGYCNNLQAKLYIPSTMYTWIKLLSIAIWANRLASDRLPCTSSKDNIEI